MANSIETHVRIELSKLERIVTAVKNFSELDVATTLDQYSMVGGFLGEELLNQYEIVSRIVGQELLPFVAGIKAERLQ